MYRLSHCYLKWARARDGYKIPRIANGKPSLSIEDGIGIGDHMDRVAAGRNSSPNCLSSGFCDPTTKVAWIRIVRFD